MKIMQINGLPLATALEMATNPAAWLRSRQGLQVYSNYPEPISNQKPGREGQRAGG